MLEDATIIDTESAVLSEKTARDRQDDKARRTQMLKPFRWKKGNLAIQAVDPRDF